MFTVINTTNNTIISEHHSYAEAYESVKRYMKNLDPNPVKHSIAITGVLHTFVVLGDQKHQYEDLKEKEKKVLVTGFETVIV